LPLAEEAETFAERVTVQMRDHDLRLVQSWRDLALDINADE